MHILNFDFFDDEQLVIVLQVNDGGFSPGESCISSDVIEKKRVLTRNEQARCTWRLSA